MATQQGYSKIVTGSLVVAYDTGDTVNSYFGRPTTNLLAGAGLSIYNNVGGDVSISLTQTSETYQGATVWREDITPTTATGVSYLTNGNNPGIGVVTSGGGGTANTYTGFSIFFKPTGPMWSNPIYTNYSNIGGWQSSTQYTYVGDGWYKAYVIWYNTITQSDGKYWAINPAGATLNVPITVFWAGPFKESLNSQYVSQFTNSARSVTESIFDISGKFKSLNSFLNASNVSYDQNLMMYFNGSSNRMQLIYTVGSDVTFDVVVYCISSVNTYNMFLGQVLPYLGFYGGNTIIFSDSIGGVQQTIYGGTVTTGKFYHIVCTRSYDGINCTNKIYVNSVLVGEGTFAGAYTGQSIYGESVAVGDGRPSSTWYPFHGYIPVAKMYWRTLSQGEINENYLHYKTRFNLP